ncbi:short-chain dehydrogenase [Saccharibacillus sp. O16]|nr:short-chain dehydrogenase [Saccharibacillus sp. O16]
MSQSINPTLSGKTALVTGASRGIGRAIARRLASEGALVAVHYGRRVQEAEETVNLIRQEGGDAFTIGADLSHMSEIHRLYTLLDTELQARTGGRTFDILVNNAGIGRPLSFEDTTEEQFDEFMSVNVKSLFFVTQAALDRLKDGGRILNISSFVTRVASPAVMAYSLSKGAVNTFTVALAQQLGSRGITVNAIMPGYTNTEMNASAVNDPKVSAAVAAISALGRWGEPGDIADIAAFLASSDSRWITGQLLDASGGSRL